VAEEKREERPANLSWPPSKEDLRRLYVEQKLSAAKIANVYGLKYANPKTAESTILHHLKKNGISSRDPAEHIRKVSEGMVDEWTLRYQKGESLKQIAGDAINPVTVFNHLHKRGVRLRDKVESQIKAVTSFEKLPFDGTEFDRAYLLGFARGDLNVSRHGRAIRVKTTSTHPGMVELFLSLFSPFGPTRVYPKFSELCGYEWTVEAELNDTFSFLLSYKQAPPSSSRREIVIAYLAGLFDADGSIWVRGDRSFGPRASYTNKDLDLINWIEHQLRKLEYFARRGGPDPREVYHVLLWRNAEVLDFIQLIPIRHPEKKAKARLLIDVSLKPFEFLRRWENLLNEIECDRTTFIQEAQHEIRKKGPTHDIMSP